MDHSLTASPFRQPRAVWAVAFACVVSFMGIGLVDPILPALGSQLRASPSHLMRSVGDHADIGRLVAVHANEAGARLVTIGGPTQRGYPRLIEGSASRRLVTDVRCDVLWSGRPMWRRLRRSRRRAPARLPRW